MNVSQLIEKLSKVDPNALVLVEAFDHMYRDTYMEVTTCRHESDDNYSEDHWHDTPENEAEYGKVLPCVVFF